MTQQTFNNLDSLLTARTVINANATDAESRLDAFEKDQEQIVYVSKVGSDSNSGLNFGSAKLTIGSAITAASAMTPSVSNQVTVQILDAGTYTEDFTLPEWVHLYGPNAGTDGEIDLEDNCIIRLRRLGNTGTGSCISKINGSGLSKVEADIMVVSSTNNEGVYLKNGQIGVTIGTVICDAGDSFVVRAGSRLVFDVQYMNLANSGRGFLTDTTGGTGNVINGNLLLVDDDGTGRFIKTVVDGDTVDIQGGQFLVDNFYDLGLNAVLNIFAHKTTGSRTAVASAEINILDTSGDSSLGGNLDFDTGKGVSFDGGDVLRDYENGLFTGTAAPQTSGTITLNTSFDTLSYKSVGDNVTIYGEMVVGSVSSPVGDYFVVTLPFSVSAGTEISSRVGSSSVYGSGGNVTVIPTRALENTTNLRVYVDCSTVTSGDFFDFAFSYPK